jgi:hypothetical protein
MDAALERMIEPLRLQASRLNKISKPDPAATPFYEVMSGGLVWTDEATGDLPTELIWALRPLFAYRSSVIAGAPSEKWRPYWAGCIAMFPGWIGFLKERSEATPELLRILKKGEKRLDRCLKSQE